MCQCKHARAQTVIILEFSCNFSYPVRNLLLFTVVTELFYTILVEPLAQKLQVQFRRSLPTQRFPDRAVSLSGHDSI